MFTFTIFLHPAAGVVSKPQGQGETREEGRQDGEGGRRRRSGRRGLAGRVRRQGRARQAEQAAG